MFRRTIPIAIGAILIIGVGFWMAVPCGACQCAPPPSERYTLELSALVEITDKDNPTPIVDIASVAPEDWRNGCQADVLPFYGNMLSFSCDFPNSSAYLNKEAKQ